MKLHFFNAHLSRKQPIQCVVNLGSREVLDVKLLGYRGLSGSLAHGGEMRQLRTWRDDPHREKAEDDFGLSARCRADDLVDAQLTNGAQHGGDMSVRQASCDIHSVVRNFDRVVASKTSPNQLNEVWRKASQ